MLNSVDLIDVEMAIVQYQTRESEDESAKIKFMKWVATIVLIACLGGLGYIMWMASTNRKINM